MGWIKDHTGSYAGGLLLLAALGIIAMGVVLMLGQDDVVEHTAPAECKRQHRFLSSLSVIRPIALDAIRIYAIS